MPLSSMIGAAATAAVFLAATSVAAAPVDKTGAMTKAMTPNNCADGFVALGFERQDDPKIFQSYSCTSPQLKCSSGFSVEPSPNKNGKATYQCKRAPPTPQAPHIPLSQP